MRYLQSGRQVAAPQRPAPFFPEVHEEISRSWRSPYSARAQAAGSHMLSSVDGADRWGYTKPPPVEEVVAAHLCPSARGWKSAPSLPSKPCRTTSHIADKAYMAAGQAASAIHTMAVLQAFQAKMLQTLDEEGPDSAAFKKLRSATDLALRATKKTAQGIGRCMGSLVTLQRHLWLTLTDMRELEKALSAVGRAHFPARPVRGCCGLVLGEVSGGPETVKGDEPFPSEERSVRCTPTAFQILFFPAFKKARWDHALPVWYKIHSSVPDCGGLRGKRPPGETDDEPLRKRVRLAAFHLPVPSHVAGNSGKWRKPRAFSQSEPSVSPAHAGGPVGAEGFNDAPQVVSGSPSSDDEPSRTNHGALQPFSHYLAAWHALPGVSEWVLNTVSSGYTLQFARRPPRFSGVMVSNVQERDAPVLRAEIRSLLAKQAIEVVPPENMECGLYSRYFLVPKKDGGLCPILDLRPLNRALAKCEFKMITVKQILAHIQPGDWFISAPRTFTKCINAALSPLRQSGIRILNYLDDWLVIAQSRDTLEKPQMPAPRAPEASRADDQCAEEQASPHAEYRILRNGSGFAIDESASLSRANAVFDQLSHLVQTGESGGSEMLSETVRAYGSSGCGVSARASAYETASAMAKIPGAKQRVEERSFACLSDSRMHADAGPLVQHEDVRAGSLDGQGGQQENRYYGCLLDGLGSPLRRQTGLWHVDEGASEVAYKLPRAEGSIFSFAGLSSTDKGSTHPGSDRQHDGGILHQPSGRYSVTLASKAGGALPPLGGQKPSVNSSSSCSRQSELLRGHAVQRGSGSWRVEAAPTDHSDDLEPVRRGGDRLVCLRGKRALSAVLLTDERASAGGCSLESLAQEAQICVSPSEDYAVSAAENQRREGDCASGSAELAQPAVVSGVDRAPNGSPVADPVTERSLISGKRLGVAPQAGVMEPACLAGERRGQTLNVSQRVLDTIAEARAPSTRRLYSLKWKVFSSWCVTKDEDPASCDVSVILSFLQDCLDAGRTPSTLKVYVAAISAFHVPIGDRSVGRHHLVTSFLRGAQRLRPFRLSMVPVWDLSLVLSALAEPPFEPLLSAELKVLSFKTALLLALACGKRVGDLHALSTNTACMEFGKDDCMVRLQPKRGYVPKVLSTSFKAQVIALQAFASQDSEPAAHPLCPVRALRVYLERTSHFRQAEQLFICFGGRTKGLPVSKQRLSHWIVEAIALAYASRNEACPWGVHAHSTRKMASSWAWAKGMSVQDICLAAGWQRPPDYRVVSTRSVFYEAVNVPGSMGSGSLDSSHHVWNYNTAGLYAFPKRMLTQCRETELDRERLRLRM
ncbi:Transposon Tf2-8 polyprotein [Labeo rohita]|uniref:Transposon Tf2-8 polyprotein n=1 Tax=Labeo rohita TaxID=84645 RepID=A0ABQ8M5J2_LABRO|nr:Transposon Tf2-8 polyprotein [Labeo rohita]